MVPLYISHMSATFGKLQQSELDLQPGLNLIYAPNESGKSTWTAFIRAMFYGLSSRERSILADKNRYVPWNGSAMGGRMDLSDGDRHYTIMRNTRRANAPMGEFSCTYSDTAIAVPGMDAQNLGGALLGVPREVFERSALIRQSALAIDQDAELERRIASLITTGEEDTSYTETYERLKKQLNRRKHNKSGSIPTLEREIDTLDGSLNELSNLNAKREDTQAKLSFLEQHLQMLYSQEAQWDQLEKQEILQKYRQAQQSAEDRQQRAELLAQMVGDLPDQTSLSQLDAQTSALVSAQSRLTFAKKNCEESAAKESQALTAYTQHALYPADESELDHRKNGMVSPKLPSKAWFSCLGISAVALFFALMMATGVLPTVLWQTIAAMLVCLSGIGGMTYYLLRKRKIARQIKEIAAQKATLAAQIAEYLPLRQAAADTHAQSLQTQLVYDQLSDQYQQDLLLLLSQVQRFHPSANDLLGAQMALEDAHRKQQALQQAQKEAHDAALRCQIMAEHLPTEPLPDPHTILPRPEFSRAQIDAQIPLLKSDIQSVRSQLDTWQGQIQAIGDPATITQQRQIKAEQLSQLQAEYEALQMAMESLESANLTLQNRFSPALGTRAAEIFSDITAGRYHKVLLSRDFSLSAESQNDPTGRSVQLLSQGAADQLYLAVRLAICDMVLPSEKYVPLILDDALLTFDEQRMQAALDYLLRKSEKRQIILFSCQKREQTYLAGREGVNMLTL